MRTTFVNTMLSYPELNPMPDMGILDAAGKLQAADMHISNLEKVMTDLLDKGTKLHYRQEEEIKNLLEKLNSNVREKSIFDLAEAAGVRPGKKYNYLLDNEDLLKFSWESVIAVGLDSTLQTEKEIFRLKDLSTLRHIFKHECPFTLLKLKLNSGVFCNTISYNFNRKDIISLHTRTIEGDWEEVDLDDTSTISHNIATDLANSIYKNIIELTNVFNNDITSGVSEIKMIIRNMEAGGKYSFDLEIDPLNSLSRNYSKPISVKNETAISSVYYSDFNPSHYSYFSGRIATDKKSYDIQLPSSSNAISFSELIPITSNDIYSIYRCPYPVSLELIKRATIAVYSDLSLKTRVAFTWSIDLSLWNFNIEDEGILYPTDYSILPKYFYVKIAKTKGSMYMTYTMQKDINSTWPLSSDGELIFDGIGITFKSKQTNLRISGRAAGVTETETTRDLFSMPYGLVGVD